MGLCKKEVSIEAILWKVVPMEIPTSNNAKNNFLNLSLVCLPVKISKRPCKKRPFNSSEYIYIYIYYDGLLVFYVFYLII